MGKGDQMAQQKAGNRWLVVVGALLVQLCLGAIYAWGTFTAALQNSNAKVAMSLSPELLGVKDSEAYASYKDLSAKVNKARESKVEAEIAAAQSELKAFIDTLDPEAYPRVHYTYLGLSKAPKDAAKFDPGSITVNEEVSADNVKLDVERLGSVKEKLSNYIDSGKSEAFNIAHKELTGFVDKLSKDGIAAVEKELIGLIAAADKQKIDPIRSNLAAYFRSIEKSAFMASLDDEWLNKTFDRAKYDKQSFGFSATKTFWIFSAGLASFAFTMILAGRLQDKKGPKVIAIIGGIVLGLGYVLAGLVGGTSFGAILFFIGIVGGAGIGLGYVCPIAASVKWFPDLKGLITGLAVAGFGAGAFIFIKLGGPWLNLIRDKGVSGTFTIFGIIFAACVVAGGVMLSNPPAGWKPAGWDPDKAKSGKPKPKVKDLTQGQIISTPQFWMIWLAFVFSAGCGLMVITCLKDFGQLEGGLSAAVAGSALGLLALFNGLGRVVWGTLSQKLTARLALMLMTVLQAVMMFVLIKMGSSPLTLAIAGCWIGFNFGGNFALFPLLTAENFGAKNLGANYGAVFTSYGVGGILGPVMAGVVWDSMHTYSYAFIIAGIACVVAAGLSFVLRPPKVAAEAPVPAEA